jgi:hypothetical protein
MMTVVTHWARSSQSFGSSNVIAALTLSLAQSAARATRHRGASLFGDLCITIGAIEQALACPDFAVLPLQSEGPVELRQTLRAITVIGHKA